MSPLLFKTNGTTYLVVGPKASQKVGSEMLANLEAAYKAAKVTLVVVDDTNAGWLAAFPSID